MKIDELNITRHVIDRYRERTGAKYSENKVKLKIKELIRSGHKEKYRSTTYVCVGNNTFVVKNKHVITFMLGRPVTWRHL